MPGHVCSRSLSSAATKNVTTMSVSRISTVGSRTSPVTPPLQPSLLTRAVNVVDDATTSVADSSFQTATSPGALTVAGGSSIAVDPTGVGTVVVGGRMEGDGREADESESEPHAAVSELHASTSKIEIVFITHRRYGAAQGSRRADVRPDDQNITDNTGPPALCSGTDALADVHGNARWR